MKNNNSSNKLLNARLLELLSKNYQSLTLNEKKEIFSLAVEHISTNYGNKLTNIIIQDAVDSSKPIAQCGFILDNGKFYHLITVNFFVMQNFPVERIILVACHECAHLFENDKIARNIDFSSELGIESYISSISRKNEDWYASEKEFEADRLGYFVSKNIFQRAVHDTEDLQMKRKLWDSFSLLSYNESIELEKHRTKMDEASNSKKNKT